MKFKILTAFVLTAWAAFDLAAMPSQEDSDKAAPVVRKLMVPEWMALKSGKKTRGEVAEVALRLARESNTEAAKLLLMKGAFVLYVKDGQTDKAIETMNAIETTIANLPPQSVTNMIELALRELPKENRTRFYQRFDMTQNVLARFRTRQKASKGSGQLQSTVDGYTWSYSIKNGEAEIEAATEGSHCAITPMPDGAITIPSSLNGVRVTSLGHGAFRFCSKLTAVTIPSCVTNIGNGVFGFCKELESIIIPSGVRRIGDMAFVQCEKLKSVTFSSGVTSLGRGLFLGCGELASFSVDPSNPSYCSRDGSLYSKDGSILVVGVQGNVVIPAGVTCIEREAFDGRRGLKTLTIPSSVRVIGFSALSNCGGLISVCVDGGNRFFKSENGLLLTKDGKKLLRGINGDVSIPYGVSEIGTLAFSGNVGLTSVSFPQSMTIIGFRGFEGCKGLKSLSIPASVLKIKPCAFSACDGLTTVIMCGERPGDADKIFGTGEHFSTCKKLAAIHVPTNAESWAGMKEWQGIPLVFDVKMDRGTSAGKPIRQDPLVDSARLATTNSKTILSGPYGIRIEADPGCEKGAQYVLERLRDIYLPAAIKFYGNPFECGVPSRTYTIHVKRNEGREVDGQGRKYTGASWSFNEKGFMIWLAKGSDKTDWGVELAATRALTVCEDAGDAVFDIYVNDFVEGAIKGIDPVPELKEHIRQGLAKGGDEKKNVRLRVWRKFAPMWSIFEELRERHPTFILDYCNLKNRRYAEGQLPQKISFDQMVDLMGESTGENMSELLKKYGVGDRKSSKYPLPKISVAQKLQTCDFLLNKDFKKNATHYLCLFSASWCGPCRREMPRIAKTYAEQLKDDPNIELIHFSRDQDDEKALAWAKEHDVKFPVVKPNGGNPLDLQSRGIPHLFILKADGTLASEGHPMKLFSDENIRSLKAGTFARPEMAIEKEGTLQQAMVDGYTWSYSVHNGEATIETKGEVKNGWHVSAVTPRPKGHCVIPSTLNGLKVTCIAGTAFSHCSEMSSVEIPTSVTMLKGGAFSWYCGVKTVSIPSSVTNVEQAVFIDCNKLESFSVDPANLCYRSINGLLCSKDGSRLVAGVNGDVAIPAGVTTIGTNAFHGCFGLKTVTIPASVTNIEFWAFAFTSPTFFRVDEGNPFFKSVDGVLLTKDGTKLIRGVNGVKAIPDGVRCIGDCSFTCSGVTSVVIPSSVTDIERSAFDGCGELTSVTMRGERPNTLGAVFTRSDKLKEIHVPSTAKSWAGMTEWQGKKLVFDAKVDVAKNRTTIKSIIDGMIRVPGRDYGSHIRSNKASVSARPRQRGSILARRNDMDGEAQQQATVDGYTWSYRVENGEATIEAKNDGKFVCAVSPSPTGDVAVPSMLNGVRVTSIGQEAFCHYCGPKSVKIPEGVKSIEWCAFYMCTNLTSVTLPTGLNRIGHGAFAGCGRLNSVVIPESVTNIAADAFRFCRGLNSVNIPSGVKRINENTFDACTRLASITFPDGLESIDRAAFYNCWRLKSVTIPRSVRVIGPAAFNRCHGLHSLTIGRDVKEIGEVAFEFCGGLTEVTMLGERPNAPKDIFKDCDKLTAIHVPANAKSWAGMKEWQGKSLVFDAK